MARRAPSASPDDDFEEHIVDIDVGDEMRTSFLEYAYSVIYSRALPDARDGLKPVQRRILHTMAEMNLRPDRGHVKSARVVGEVMGRLHPHGDGAIYDALVRLVQPWSMRLPLVDGHGTRARAVWWNGATAELPSGQLDFLVRLERNDYGESSFPRLVVLDVRPAAC